MPPPCFHRPWRSISWVGAPFWAMRRAMPTRPLWSLKNSQSGRPAALAMTFTRRAICDSDSPDTLFPRPPAGWRPVPASPRGDGHHRALGLHVGLGANDGEAAAAVVPALHVAPGEGGSFAAAQTGVGQRRHQGQVNLTPFGGLLGGLDAAATPAGLDGGEPDHGEHVGGEGAGLPLGLRQPTSPSFQRGAHARVPAGRILLRPLVGLGDGGRGQAQGGDAGAGSGAGGQVAGHGEGLGRQGREAHLVAPAGEQFPLCAIDAPGVVGQDRLQGVGHALVSGPQLR